MVFAFCFIFDSGSLPFEMLENDFSFPLWLRFLSRMHCMNSMELVDTRNGLISHPV